MFAIRLFCLTRCTRVFGAKCSSGDHACTSVTVISLGKHSPGFICLPIIYAILKKKHKKNRNIYKDVQWYLIPTSPLPIFTQTITFAIVYMFVWWFDQKKLTRMFTWKTLVLRTLYFSCVHTSTCIAAISLRKRVAGFVNLSQMYTGCCKENFD